LYSTITIMISLPATIKVVNWTLTLLNGALKVDVAFLFSVSYILVFLVGGFTGMWLSHVGLNVSLHDTFYVVAHFHLMLSGVTIIGSFAGYYYYFIALHGVKYSRIFGYLHLFYYSGGIWLTFLPMFWVGSAGLPRRVHDYPVIFAGWQSMATAGHFTTLVGITFFFLMILDSHLEKRVGTTSTLGIPRWHKRVSYYLFKITSLQQSAKSTSRIPGSKIRRYLSESHCNEYELFEN
jgi:cytochrome c oxidase subunit 1